MRISLDKFRNWIIYLFSFDKFGLRRNDAMLMEGKAIDRRHCLAEIQLLTHLRTQLAERSRVKAAEFTAFQTLRQGK
jgi:hypothetical protein